MLFTKAFAAILTGAGLLFQDAIAHSLQRRSLSYVTRIDDATIETPSHRVHSHTSFAITFLLHNGQQNVRLSLKPNDDIFSDDATITYIKPDGTTSKVEPIDRKEHRVFQGESFTKDHGDSEWKHAGWARITVHRDGSKPVFEGVFTINHNHHHVNTLANYRQTAVAGDPEVGDEDAMVVWRDTDISAATHEDLKRDVGAEPSCGSDTLFSNQDESNLVYRAFNEPVAENTTPWHLSPRALFGRQDTIAGGNGAGVNLAGSIGSTAGCPSTRKVALVGIATDCSYTARFPNKEEVRKNIIQLVNSASVLYENTFNISLGIQNLTISESECPGSPPASAPWNTACSDSISITDRLSQFSAWRGQWRDTNAYWTLLTTCATGNAVGLAWLGAICQQGTTQQRNETTASANVVVRTSTEWLVFAHETGHTFGAVHDCQANGCADGSAQRSQCCPLSSNANNCDASGRFIMNPSTGNGITTFSPCSVGNICSFLSRSPQRSSCLTSNRGVVTITGSQCGNGIVEPGEECDCGGDQNCRGNPCCNPTTCRFTTNSQCDFSNDECCSRQCRFQSQGTICRPSTGPCDPEETCSGSSALCPSDKTSPDGQSCGDGGAGLSCASGRCTSRDLQCKTMMGHHTTHNDTKSCAKDGCSISCSSPDFRPAGTCWVMNQYFLDGTPCQGGGTCSNGNCQNVQLSKQILEWIEDNKPIFIPVVVVVGALFLMAIISCCWSCFRRSSRKHQKIKPPPPMYQPYGPMPAMRGPPQSHMQQRQGWEPMRTRSFRYA